MWLTHMSFEKARSSGSKGYTKENSRLLIPECPVTGVQRLNWTIFSYFWDYYFFCFVVAICDLVRAVDATNGIP